MAKDKEVKERVTFTVRMDAKVHKGIRIFAAHAGMTTQDAVDFGLASFLGSQSALAEMGMPNAEQLSPERVHELTMLSSFLDKASERERDMLFGMIRAVYK